MGKNTSCVSVAVSQSCLASGEASMNSFTWTSECHRCVQATTAGNQCRNSEVFCGRDAALGFRA